VDHSNLPVLFDQCEVSPFGHGGKTVVDETVRKALQIKAERITNVEELDLQAQGIIGKIKDIALCKHIGVCDLDKLNVYGPDGFFETHKDTPRDKDCFGTLMVCLPCRFAGGYLLVWPVRSQVFLG
jgi:hypothetical protein